MSLNSEPRFTTNTFTIEGPRLTIHASDAVQVRNPPADRMDNEKGQFHRSTLQPLSSKTSKYWRRQLGDALAQRFLLLGSSGGGNNARAVTRQLPQGELDYILTSFPPGYHLYSRSVGSRLGTDEIRRDSYLYGAGRTFRSPNEVLCHFAWLMRGQDQFLCKCIYCTPLKAYKGRQKALNKLLDEHWNEMVDARVRRKFETTFGRRAASPRPRTPVDVFNDFFVLQRPSMSGSSA